MRITLHVLLATAALASNAAHANTCGNATLVGVGDTFNIIAERCGVSLAQIMANNPDTAPTDLSIGHIVSIAPSASGRDVYDSWFIGAYSPNEICAGQETQLDLTPNSVTFVDSTCGIKNVVYDTANAVYVNLTACTAEGELQPDRFINLSWGEDDVLSYEGSAGYSLKRCTDR